MKNSKELVLIVAMALAAFGCGKKDDAADKKGEPAAGVRGGGESGGGAPAMADVKAIDCDKVATQTVACMKQKGVTRAIDEGEIEDYRKNCWSFKGGNYKGNDLPGLYKPDDPSSAKYARDFIAYSSGTCP